MSDTTFGIWIPGPDGRALRARTWRRADRKAEREEHLARMAAIHAESLTVVKSGHCPDCGSGLHLNSSIAGWWQCDRSGSGSFRRDQTGQSCQFQCFTE